jgi:hypothetical protein
VAYAFISPSGAGLKVGILVPPCPDAPAYGRLWHIVAAHYGALYGAAWDTSGSDIARLCFVSYDPAVYIQDSPQLFVPPSSPPVTGARQSTTVKTLNHTSTAHGGMTGASGARRVRFHGAASGEKRPGDVLAEQMTWAELLLPAGWTLARQTPDASYWTRPGKTSGISASTDGGGFAVLYVFSSNAPPFQPHTSYTKFAVYTLLRHSGDYGAAARALARQQRRPLAWLRDATPEEKEEKRRKSWL